MVKRIILFACLILFISCGWEIALCKPAFKGGISIVYEAGIQKGELPEDSFRLDYTGQNKGFLTGPAYVPNQMVVKFKETAAAKLEEQLWAGKKADEIKLSDSLDELGRRYGVRKVRSVFRGFREKARRMEALLKKDQSQMSRRERHLVERQRRAAKGTVIPSLERIYRLDVGLRKGQTLEEAVQAYKSDGGVEYAELNYIVRIAFEPNDANYPLQWALNNVGQMYPWSGQYNPPPGTADADIDGPQAWDIYTGNTDIIVAVMDSGVDYTHRDLDDNMWTNDEESNGQVGVDDDENGYVDDVYGYDFCTFGQLRDSDPDDETGHGTHVAGIIAAEGDNGLDIAGICWRARIMSLKFINSSGSGILVDAMEAFYYAVENGADVLSNSWGGGGFVQFAQDTIDYAYSRGAVMVAAAGNNNSNLPFYPAGYDHMISVAATNSNDGRAPFSNYGSWIDVAAPGVDILSLRASGTAMGTTYGNYLTVASGTSMACPHAAGACALLLSTNPTLTNDDVNDILRQTGDAIAAGICDSNSRINIYNALLASTTSQGIISLDRDYYQCSGFVNIWLADRDLGDNNTQDVNLAASGGDLERITLDRTIATVGVFRGTIQIGDGEPNSQNGTLELSDGEGITVTYEDANDGTGNPATVTDNATADCAQPVIYNVSIDVPGPEPRVSFDTNEPTSGKVLYGLVCAEPNAFVGVETTLSTSHSIKLAGVAPQTTYYYTITAVDVAGNETIDDNDGACYTFTTDGPNDINVPGDYATIHEAVDRSWDGSRILIADGVYGGEGNRDIDFGGKAITIMSENGPANCIIDCNGTVDEPHRGFKFVRGEGPNSVLEGVTIRGGYGPEEEVIYFLSSAGNAIFCDLLSSPTIRNCRIEGNSGGRGAIFCLTWSSPTISDCIITGNSTDAEGVGAGIYCGYISSPTVSNCIISGNNAANGGGVFCWLGSAPIFRRCIISGNRAQNYGGALLCNQASPRIVNCTITGNLTTDAGSGIWCRSDSRPKISNSIMWGDIGDINVPEIYLSGDSSYKPVLTVLYSDVAGGESQAGVDPDCTLIWGPGNIDVDPCFATAGVWADPCNTPGDVNDDVWIEGDYHLQSAAGRWDANTSSWVTDANISYCIDAGNPASSLGSEPNDTNNIRINMGAYGGTVEASRSPVGWSLLADLTNDGSVDFVDLRWWAEYWLDSGTDVPADLNRDQLADIVDFGFFGKGWREETVWHNP